MAMSNKKDAVLTDAGVLSTTFGSMLKTVAPGWDIHLYERLDHPGIESSNERNNAGTEHAALCELNCTVQQPDGSIDVEKAREINEQFEIPKQFWGRLVKPGEIQNPKEFINPLPHISFVHGKNNVKFLKDRYEAMKQFPMFGNIGYTEDIEEMRKWIPLMIRGRGDKGYMAASRIDEGTDVNYGELTRKTAQNLRNLPSVEVQYKHEVVDSKRLSSGKRPVRIKNLNNGQVFEHQADYVFIGAGSSAIPLLQKTGIPESKRSGGFPISGRFIACTNPQVIEQHDAKVYGKEPPGTPPTTVSHLDTRYIDSERTLLSGPFANVGPKFLRHGSNLDSFKSIKPYNITTLLASAVKSLPLIKYSFDQVTVTREDCMNHLRTFYPEARDEDWQVYTAGKRVQAIKDTEENGKGFIQFGTEVVNSEDHSVTALLGESPGTSALVSVALEVLEKNFPEHVKNWELKIKKMIPSYGGSPINDVQLMRKICKQASKDLELGFYNKAK